MSNKNIFKNKKLFTSSYLIEKPMSPLGRPKSATQRYVEDKVFSLTTGITQDEHDDESEHDDEDQSNCKSFFGIFEICPEI